MNNDLIALYVFTTEEFCQLLLLFLFRNEFEETG